MEQGSPQFLHTRCLHTQQPGMLITHRLFLDNRGACCFLGRGAGGGGNPGRLPACPGEGGSRCMAEGSQAHRGPGGLKRGLLAGPP